MILSNNDVTDALGLLEDFRPHKALSELFPFEYINLEESTISCGRVHVFEVPLCHTDINQLLCTFSHSL